MRTINLFFSGLIVVGSVLLYSFNTPDNFSNETPVGTILAAYGDKLPSHARPNASQETIQKGRELIFNGRTTAPNGGKSRYISKFYTCVSCHSPVQEDPDLRYFDPQARLDYAARNKLKFLQGSTFYGIANREHWYNDDYVLKYGDLVKPAAESLIESTKLCAIECSSGRPLEEWELEAILAYFWNNQIKLGDLNLTQDERKIIQTSPQEANPKIVELLKSKYALKSPATFGHMPENQQEGYPGLKPGNPENGKKIYELSCMACHQEGGVSGTTFEQTKADFSKFKRNIGVKADYNLYQIVRKGTYADHGKRRYMPLFTEQRMTNQQLEDLVAYIRQEAN